MSLYKCSVDGCDETTRVVDSRQTNDRTRRRRECNSKHRFSTIEVPVSSRNSALDLILWAGEQDLNDPDIHSYINEQLDNIFYGKALSEEF